ncbi:DUF551 domain-containing protein [Psychrobacter raelei]|uniref:DUF551 domain-containing protein n=1 Tax=Psychrobacter raelei TaxID=2565531 RepID=A0AAT9PBK9_9GAMM|nr:DUF551 domain-containing protein [Psychrobacter sp. PraFG1]UNK04755.1 DUF551 domain-containing protein [Psychrobacter sp. PraFG1]
MNNWISVKDRLPDMHKRVLIKGDATYVAGRAPTSNQNDDWGIKGDWYWSIVSDFWIDAHMITHWQPLPEPPRGDSCE